MNHLRTGVLGLQNVAPTPSSPSAYATTLCLLASLFSFLKFRDPVRPGDERLKTLSNGVEGTSTSISMPLATMSVIASTGAMLLSGHRGASAKSALACRTESLIDCPVRGNSTQVPGRSDPVEGAVRCSYRGPPAPAENRAGRELNSFLETHPSEKVRMGQQAEAAVGSWAPLAACGESMRCFKRYVRCHPAVCRT
jgi:hypothetical protein